MKHKGHTLVEIAHVFKHKNSESLKHYLDVPTLKDKENLSKSLFKYADKQSNQIDENDSDDFEPVPKQRIKKNRRKSKPSATISVPPKTTDNQVEIFDNKQDKENRVIQSQNQNTVTQTYRQNPIGMFVGANLNNCTININMLKGDKKV